MARTGVASHDGWPRTRSPRATWQDGPAGGMAGLPPVRGHGGGRRPGGGRRGRGGGGGGGGGAGGGARGGGRPAAGPPPPPPRRGASPSPSPSPSVRPHFPPGGPWRMMPPGGGSFGGPGALGGLLGAVHGTAVVPKPGGGYQTVAFQNGKVTAVSSTSIMLRSADGYSRTYRVTSSTLVNA